MTAMTAADYGLALGAFLAGVSIRPYFDRHIFPTFRRHHLGGRR